ncbi:chemotaxis protein CheC [Lentibacillus salinarum]|uniref:Chemotaxis protein CheC n=1 Tax=Lentibacillus salinarum TaxID=446820 RepID=A0ABW3ZQ07_9BACI
MVENNFLTDIQLDVLREIGNIGAGHAAASMSALMNKKIDMRVPIVTIVPFVDVLEWVGGLDRPVAGMMIHISGDLPGTIYFMLNIDEDETLVRCMTDRPKVQLVDNGKPDRFGVSLFKETDNILAASYFTALADFTGLQLQPSVPYLQIDMAGAILSHSLIEVSQMTDHALIIDTAISYSGGDNPVRGGFLFLPHPDAFSTLFQSVGIEEDG